MRSRLSLAVAGVIAAGCATAPEARPETAAFERTLPAALDALDALDASRKSDGPYRLIAARQHPADGGWAWHFTFKAEEHLPADPSRQLLTAGGEIFVTVDPAGDATVRYGE